jgi:hypothetical protein
MVRVKDDWTGYNRARKHEFSTFIREAKKVLARIGPPVAIRLEPGTRPMGRPPYDPGAMLIVNLLRIYLKLTYREIETLLQQNGQLRRTIGLDNVPGRDTINRYAKTLDEAYLVKFNDQLTARLKKTSVAQPSMPPVSRSKGTRSVGTLPSQKAKTG